MAEEDDTLKRLWDYFRLKHEQTLFYAGEGRTPDHRYTAAAQAHAYEDAMRAVDVEIRKRASIPPDGESRDVIAGPWGDPRS